MPMYLGTLLSFLSQYKKYPEVSMLSFRANLSNWVLIYSLSQGLCFYHHLLFLLQHFFPLHCYTLGIEISLKIITLKKKKQRKNLDLHTSLLITNFSTPFHSKNHLLTLHLSLSVSPQHVAVRFASTAWHWNNSYKSHWWPRSWQTQWSIMHSYLT